MDGLGIPASLTDPWAYIAVVAIGVIVFGIRAVITGKLRTKDELDAVIKRAETAEAALRVRDVQANAALAVLPQVAEVLEKFHAAGEEVRAEQARRGDPA